jgi:hypothetical protein
MIKAILHTISIWIIILPAIAGFINFKGLNRDSRWIFYLVLVAIFPQILTFIINQDTVLLAVSYNVYTPVEFIILFLLFKDKFHMPFNRMVHQCTLYLYILFSVIIITRSSVTIFLSEWVCLNNIIYIIWILFFLKEQFFSETFVIRKRNSFAWYLFALILYAPLTLITFALYHYMRQDSNSVLRYLSVIQDICNILLYVFFTIGLYMSENKPTQRDL